MEQKRKRGAQPGNQNARSHGFYSPTFTPEQQATLHTVIETSGEDPEIAALLVKITAIIAQDPINLRVFRAACSSLLALLQARQSPDADDVKIESIRTLLRLSRPRAFGGSRFVSLLT